MSAEEELRQLLEENPELKYELSKFQRKALDVLGIEE